jgi:hypothetical protein
MSQAELKQELQSLSGQSSGSNDDLVSLVEDTLSNVRTMDDLYLFFSKTLPELRLTLATVNPVASN